MADKSCSTCPALRAQIAQLQRQNDQLRILLQDLRATVAGQVRFIDQETEPGEATMSRDQLAKRVRGRLAVALEAAGGRL